MKIEQIKIEKLIPYANNARTHSDEQIAQLAGSIQLVGFRDPVEIDENNTIVVGHGRVLAARKLGMEEVPCIRHHFKNEGEMKSYIIANNKIALNSGWDDELLKIELEGLSPAESLATGFTPDEINLLFRAWDSDIEKMDNIEPKDSIAKEKIVISCDPDNKDFVWEKVTNLIDSLGLEDVIVS